MRSNILAALPYPIQIIVGLLAYRGVMRTLNGQGTARFSAEEIRAFRRQIWEDVNALLVASRAKAKKAADDDDEGTFWVLGGEGPSEADATVFGFVVSAMVCEA